MFTKAKQSIGDKARQLAKSVVHEAGEATKSVSHQVVGGNVDRPSPIVEAMQQDSGMSEIEKKKLRVYKDRVERNEEEEEKYRKLREQLGEQHDTEIEEKFQVVNPGERVDTTLPVVQSRHSRKMGTQKQTREPNIEMRKGKQ